MNFTQATEYCRSMDAILAEPKTEEEHGVIHDYAKSLDTVILIWLGATDSASEGTWVWQSDDEPLTYDKWADCCPRGDGRHCLVMSVPTGLFIDQLCSHSQDSYDFLCQRKVQGNFLMTYIIL